MVVVRRFGSGVLTPLVRGPRAALIVGLVAMAAHSNGLANGFAYDDVHLVVENEAIHSLATLPEALAAPYWPGEAGGMQGLWRPLTTFALGVGHALWGLAPGPYHALNIALHGLVSGLVVLLFAGLMPPLAALLGGLVFAVHPVHVEAVANVVGLGELLSALFFLTACLLAMRGDGGTRIVVIAGLYALAFLAKESAVTLPAVIVLLDASRRSVPIGEVGAYLRRRGPLLGALVLTALAILVVRAGVLGSVVSPEAPIGSELLGEIPRIWTLGVIWGHYARLLLFPLRLAADYAPDTIPILTVWTPAALFGAGVVLGSLTLALLSWRKPALGSERLTWKVLGFGVVWLVVTIAPVSNLLFLSGILLAERTLYLPSVGIVAVVGAGLAALARIGPPRPAFALAAAVIALLASRSWTRTPVWRDSGTVFTALLEEQPASGRAQWALGDVLRGRGDEDGAYRAYARAVGALNGTYRLLTDVGWQAHEDGRDRLAEHMLLRAWEESPELPRAPRNLALLYQDLRRFDDVARFSRETVTLLPGDVASWHLLASALTTLGQWDEAIAARERVIGLGEGEHWQQWFWLANLRLTAGDSARASAALDSALARADSDDVRSSIQEAYGPLPVPPEGSQSPL